MGGGEGKGEWVGSKRVKELVSGVHLQKRSSKGVPSAVAKRRTHQIRGKMVHLGVRWYIQG